LAQKHPKKIDGRIYLGEPLPKREIHLKSDGEICVRGETLFQGYLNNGKIESPLNNGWFETGDIGHYDLKGGIAIIGRKDGQFICGGENIQPEEIERYLLLIPDILEAVVVPKEDPEFGMRPVAVIRTLGPRMTLQKIQIALGEHLPKYKIPVALYQLDEIPKNGLKIDRKQIKNWFKNGI
jgi:O-succinylbenzoic acid--CoA ligase